MPKKDSPVKYFPGSVTFPDFLNLEQVRLLEDALKLQEIMEKGIEAVDGNNLLVSISSAERLPVILKCGLKFNLKNIPKEPTLDTFPMTPINAAGELVNWLFTELINIWTGEVEVPNE